MSAANGHIRFGRFVLDTGRHALTEKGRTIPLTPKAFDLLRTLVENPDRLLTKDELMERVWSDSFVEEGNLAYTVRLLRKALGDDASAPTYIESVPRRGYRFIATCYEERVVNDPAIFPAPKVEEDDAGALIGRESDIARIIELLQNDKKRLVTLTGAGGTGKTRLAREIAELSADLFSDGVYFVELANVTDPKLVPSTIAQELSIQDTGITEPVKVLADHFGDKVALLILDNFEQILPAGIQLAELLRHAPNLKLLITSREPLKLRAEQEYRVPPLELPSLKGNETIADVMRFGAVKLFVRRARMSRPDLEVANDDVDVLTSICRSLDGLPLALELAASRAKVLSLEELLSKLENRLALLTGGPNDVPTRQQTMRATIEWSYALLTEQERWLFETLAVFEGSFKFKAAENVVVRLSENHQFSETDVVNGIESLTEKGLLVSEPSMTDDLRFRMLVVVRDYALELMTSRPDADAARLFHTEYFLNFSESGGPNLFSTHCGEWLDRFEAELDNIRACLRWSRDNNLEYAGRILAVVRHLCALRMHTSEVRYWLEEALERPGPLEPSVRVELLTGLGVVCQYHRDLVNGRAAHEQSMEISRQLTNKKTLARDLRGVAAIDYMESKVADARKRTEEALALSRSINDEFGEAAALSRLADISNLEGDANTAHRFVTEALEIFRRLDYHQGITSKLVNLSITEFLLGNFQAARDPLIESVNLAVEIADYIDFRVHLETAAALNTEHGNLRTAAKLSGAAAAHCEDMKYFHEPLEQRFRETYLERLKAAMTASDFDEAYSEGTRLPVTDAIALILESLKSPEAVPTRLHLVGGKRSRPTA